MLLRTVPFALSIAASIAACSSSGTQASTSEAADSATRSPISIRYVTYATGQKLGLVNPAHSDRTELYSKTVALSEAGTKVTTNEVIDETLAEFERRGLFELMKPGAAPATAPGSNPQALEITRDGRTSHALATKTSPPDEKRRFLECAQVFAEIYNAVYQLQSVDKPPDWETQTTQGKSRPRKDG